MERRNVRIELAVSILALLMSLIFLSIFLIERFDPMLMVVPIMIISITTISLIFYVVNPEIMRGIWLSKKRYKEIKQNEQNNRNIKIGRNILLGHVVVILPILLIFYFQSIFSFL